MGPLADTELHLAIGATATMPALNAPWACTQELDRTCRAAELLRLTVSSTSTEAATIFRFAAAATAAHHWVCVVITVAASHPELIRQQERELAALTAHFLFEKLPEQLRRSWPALGCFASNPDVPAPEGSPEGEEAMLVAAAAAGGAAVGLLQLQEWVRDGVLPAVLPTDTPQLATLVDVLALAVAEIMSAESGQLAHQRGLARGMWVVEQGVLPFLYYATTHAAHVGVVGEVLMPQPHELAALVRYCEERIQAVMKTLGDPWQVPQLEPLVLGLSIVARWPSETSDEHLQELEAACKSLRRMALAAVELLERMWNAAGKVGELEQRLARAARIAAVAEAIMVICQPWKQRSLGDPIRLLYACIAPAALTAAWAAEQLAAWAAGGAGEQGLQHSIQRYELQQATARQLLVLLSAISCLNDLLKALLGTATSVAQRRQLCKELPGRVGYARGPRAALVLEVLARLTGFLAWQRQRDGLEALGLARVTESIKVRLLDLDAGLISVATLMEFDIWGFLSLEDLPEQAHSPQLLAQLPDPAQLQSLAHALAARTNVLLAPQAPGACGLPIQRKAFAEHLAPSLAAASKLVLKRSRVDGGSFEEHLRDYSAVGWVLAPAACALLSLDAEEGAGDAADQLVQAFANLASAGLGDILARCGCGAVLHLGFEMPEHNVPQRTTVLVTLTAACKESPGLCVSLGREGFLDKLVGTAAAFAASRQGTAISRSRHLKARLELLGSACATLDGELGTAFLPALLAVSGVAQCTTSQELSAQLRSMLKERRLWNEVKTVVDQVAKKCSELYEEACQQEETCALRDLAVGRWAGVGCCNPGCCGAGGWGPDRKLKMCTGCRVAKFCSQECLKQDWARHRPACRALAQRGSK